MDPQGCRGRCELRRGTGKVGNRFIPQKRAKEICFSQDRAVLAKKRAICSLDKSNKVYAPPEPLGSYATVYLSTPLLNSEIRYSLEKCLQ